MEPSEATLMRYLVLVRAEVNVATQANAELAKLIVEQERDDLLSHLVSRSGAISLDAVLFEDGSERYDLVGSADLDPAAILIEEENVASLTAATGGRSEEDIARLDYPTQQWIADKLREEGLVGAISVQRAERIRLREPQTHTGAGIHGGGSWGGKAKRLEKVRAQRHKRPSRKPPKRWSRERWYEEEAA
jgi:hypothetical protein